MSDEIADKYIAACTLRTRVDDRTSDEFKRLNKECKILAKQWFDAVAIETIRTQGLPRAGFVPNAAVAAALGFEIAPKPTGLVKPVAELPQDTDMTKIKNVIIERAASGVMYASLLHLFLQAVFYQKMLEKLTPYEHIDRRDFNRWVKNKSVRSLVLDGVLGIRVAKSRKSSATSPASSRAVSPARAGSEPRTPRQPKSARVAPSGPTKTPKSPRARDAGRVARQLFKSPRSQTSGPRSPRGASAASRGRGGRGGRGASRK